MALLDIHCKKCGNDFQMDIGDKTIEEVRAILEKRDGYHCNAGNHMEFGSPLFYWVLGELHEGSAPTEDEWKKLATERHGHLISNDELRDKFEVTGFFFGSCMAKVKVTGQEVCLEFIHSPKGERYYYGYLDLEYNE
jgi:hypothetical protein